METQKRKVCSKKMKYLVEFNRAKEKIEGFLKVFDNAVFHNAIDAFEWKTLFSASGKLKEIEKDGRAVYKQYVTIMQDVFYSLYKIH